MKHTFILLAVLICIYSTQEAVPASSKATAKYFDNTGRADVLSGGVRMIEVQTPKGKFKVSGGPGNIVTPGSRFTIALNGQ